MYVKSDKLKDCKGVLNIITFENYKEFEKNLKIISLDNIQGIFLDSKNTLTICSNYTYQNIIVNNLLDVSNFTKKDLRKFKKLLKQKITNIFKN